MTDCPSCGATLKDGDWTCGRCGAPVAGAGMAAGGAGSGHGGGGAGAPPDPYGYAPGFEPQPAAAGAPAPAGTSGTMRLVIILAVLAIIAIVAVWFFVIRGAPGTNGDEFLGTWNATDSGISQVVVVRPEETFKVTLTGAEATQKATVPAHIDGDELVITLDDFATLAGEANADRFKDTIKAVTGDFSIIFSSVDATHLRMKIEAVNASGQEANNAVTLTKATP